MKTAENLGISQEMHDALVWVRNMLNEQQIVHVPDDQYPMGRNGFNMRTSSAKYECGSVGCIGGWAWVAMNLDAVERDADDGLFKLTNYQTDRASNFVHEMSSKELLHLFFPPFSADYDSITTKEAALAIDNYLTTGYAQWESVLE